MYRRRQFSTSLAAACFFLTLAAGPVVRGQSEEAERERQTDELLQSHDIVPVTRACVAYLKFFNEGKLAEGRHILRTPPSVDDALTSGRVGKLVARINLEPPAHLALVSFDFLSPEVFTMVFLATDKDGPIAVKFCLYSYGKDNSIGKIDATDDWDQIERWAATGTRLPTPYTINLKPNATTAP